MIEHNHEPRTQAGAIPLVNRSWRCGICQETISPSEGWCLVDDERCHRECAVEEVGAEA